MHSQDDHAVCRGCGTILVDAMGLPARPYYTGNRHAYHPISKRPAKTSYYGGFACSDTCDMRSALEHEQSMPGHGSSQTSASHEMRKKIAAKWKDS